MARAGQAERVRRTWADGGTNYSATYTWSLLGLSGYSNTGVDEPTTPASVTSWIVRAPDGTPVAQRYSNGSEYYYLFDGQGDVVGLEDPGVMLAAYDFCPTGNEADLASTIPTTVALGNPLRQGGAVYDDLTKDYFGQNGVIKEDSNGTGTQILTSTEQEALGVAVPECNARDINCLYKIINILVFVPYAEYYFSFKALSLVGLGLPPLEQSVLMSAQDTGLGQDMALDYIKNQLFQNGEPVYDEGYTGRLLGTGTNSPPIYLPGAEVHFRTLDLWPFVTFGQEPGRLAGY